MGQKRNIISPSCERKKYTFFRKPTTLKKLGHSVLINWNGLLCIACETLPKDETGQRTNGHWTHLDICDEMKISSHNIWVFAFQFSGYLGPTITQITKL